jgi:uncharacterized protein (DUF2141 family)
MAYISGFGTGFAALILGLALSANAATVASILPSSTLDVSISGLRSVKGNVLICLTAKPKAFPDCSKDAGARKMIVAAKNSGKVEFGNVAPGTYAISLIHDENGNGKLDTRIIIPREGFGFSRNPTITFGPPKFAAASFGVVPGMNNQSVKFKYML